MIDNLASWLAGQLAPCSALHPVMANSPPKRSAPTSSGTQNEPSAQITDGLGQIAAFYIRQSRARGVETRVRPYAIAGIIVAVGLTVVALWELHNPPVENPIGLNGLPYRLVSPGATIGLALLVLAWAERNRALLLLSLAYRAAVVVPITFGGVHHDPPWYSYPVVFQGSAAPVVAGSGTGAYKEISGSFKLTIAVNEVDAKPGCQPFSGGALLAQSIFFAGSGTVSFP